MISEKDLLYQCVDHHRFIVKEAHVRDGMKCIECGLYSYLIGYAKNFQTDGLRTMKPASKLEIKVRVSDTDLFNKLVKVICDVKDDERIPVTVRNELKDKVNDILLEHMGARDV